MIPLFAPVRQNESLLPQIQQKLSDVLRGGEYVLGKEVERFEGLLARKLGFNHAVGCSSGTDALILALKALDFEPGAEIITPAFSFVASANVVPWAGFRPVFADIDPETANVTVETVQKAITPRTRAVIAVDLYGRQAPIPALRKMCDNFGLHLIEDGAQSVGVPSHGTRGAHFFTTSFYPTKNLGCLGDGGAVLTQDPELATRVREMTRHGGLMRDHYVRFGTTARLDTLQAAVLSVKLDRLEAWTAQRRTIAAWYAKHLKAFSDSGIIALPPSPSDEAQHVWALYTIRVLKASRNGLAERLREREVGCGIYYPKAIPRQPSMAKFQPPAFPAAEKLAGEVLSLPLYPELTAREFESVVKSVAECLGRNSI